MKIAFNNKVAIVSGASKGIGNAIAKALARSGCQVVLIARGEKELLKAAEETQKFGSRAHACCVAVYAKATMGKNYQYFF